MERKKRTAPSIAAMKKAGERIAVLTAYDYMTAKLVDEAGVDMILVGDSAAMVVLGHENTLPVTLDEMVMLTAAVARARTSALVVGDMPFMSYQASAADAVRTAGRMVKDGGAGAVKLEGGRKVVPKIEAVIGRRHPRDGAHRPDAAVDPRARRLPRAGQERRDARAAARRREGAGGGRLLLDGARGHPVAARAGDHRVRVDPDHRHRRGRRAATARCSSSTTSSGTRTGRPRSSSAATGTRGSVVSDAAEGFVNDVKSGRLP